MLTEDKNVIFNRSIDIALNDSFYFIVNQIIERTKMLQKNNKSKYLTAF